MRPAPSRCLRVLAASLLAGLALASPARAGEVEVTVGGQATRMSPNELRAHYDVAAGGYRLRAAGAPADDVAHPPALSVRRLIELTGASPDAVSFVSLERADGTRLVLSGADIADPPPFPEGPPLVWADADAIRFLRPLRDAGDVNAGDNLSFEGIMRVRVQHGALLAVRASAEPSRVAVGEPVRLRAAVDGINLSAASCRWTLGDGSTADGCSVSHTFGDEGAYAVTVAVTGPDDSGGASSPLQLRVGRPPSDGSGVTGAGRARRDTGAAQGAASPGRQGRRGGATGRGDGVGGTTGEAEVRSRGARRARPAAGVAPPAPAGAPDTDGGAPVPTPTPAAVAPAGAPARAASPPATSPVASEDPPVRARRDSKPVSRRQAERAAAVPPRADRPPPRSSRRTPAPGAASETTDTVRGVLVADLAAPAPASPANARATRAEAASARRGSPERLVLGPQALAGMLALGLIGVGVGLERRRSPLGPRYATS